jgi:GNAT superfamily N-acetyltransferase
MRAHPLIWPQGRTFSGHTDHNRLIMHTEPPWIRSARVEDAAAAAACHVACWREAYANIVDPAVLAQRTGDLTERARRWRQQLEAGTRRWVAVASDDEVVGFAARRLGRDEDIDLPCELAAIYIRRAYWGSGLAARLLHAAIGDEGAYLWVFEANERARGFYARHGFVPDGTAKHDPFFDRIEIRMVRPAHPQRVQDHSSKGSSISSPDRKVGNSSGRRPG